MPQLLLPAAFYSFTPPSSPTKLSETINWLKRTPMSVPLPPSPTKSCDSFDTEPDFNASTESLALTHSKFWKNMNSSPKESRTLPLQGKTSSSSLVPSPVGTSQREASRWLFRPSPVRAASSASPADELGDHFARSLPTSGEKQEGLRRRRKAAQERVDRMRVHLGINAHEARPSIALSKNNLSTAIGGPGSSGKHQRYDSGSHEHGDSDAAFRELQKLHTATTTEVPQEKPIKLPPTHEDFLYHSLFRIQNRNLRQFDCVGCKTTHKQTLHRETSDIWLLQGCRHYVHAACFDKIRDDDTPSDTGNCFHCSNLKRNARAHSQKGMNMRLNRLLDRKSGIF